MTTKTKKATKKRRKPPMSRRMYYGPPGHEQSMWWTLRVRPATAPVIIDGDTLHALRANRGVTIGCALSNTAADNRKIFPHEVFLISFTQTTALVMEKKFARRESRYDGTGILYSHSYGKFVNDNDTGRLRKLAETDETVMNRPFTLRPYKKHKDNRDPHRNDPDRKAKAGESKIASKRAFVHRGALARAVKAGLIDRSVAQQLTHITNEKTREQAAHGLLPPSSNPTT